MRDYDQAPGWPAKAPRLRSTHVWKSKRLKAKPRPLWKRALEARKAAS